MELDIYQLIVGGVLAVAAIKLAYEAKGATERLLLILEHLTTRFDAIDERVARLERNADRED